VGRQLKICVLSALGLAALLPASAAGSSAFLSGGDELGYLAAAGETNTLTVTRSGANYILTDPGATITPLGGCAAVNANTVSCAAALVTDFDVRLNDLNDSATLGASVTGNGLRGSLDGSTGNDGLTNSSTVEVTLSGGAGNDTLTGGPARDRLIGGGDDDVAAGNGGSDSFDEGPGIDQSNGGAGDDRLSSSQIDGPDSFSGGPGTDEINYQSRFDSVVVDLDGVADDGAGCPGLGCEGDNVGADVEDVRGGSGSDTLTGTASDNNLSGGNGDDVISGGGGGDSLDGGDDDDSLDGGGGDDSLDGGDDADVIDGGGGDDELRGDLTDFGADTLGGGGGIDSADISAQGRPVRVVLDGVANDGPTDPGLTYPKDNLLPDVENLENAGDGDDTLIGSAAPNEIEGGGGDDQIIGGGGGDALSGDDGNDTIDGGGGVDSLFGGGGSDSLRSRDSSSDQIDCGSSPDLLLADGKDDPEASCEKTSTGLLIAGSAKLAGKSIKLKLSCPAAEGIACKAKVKLKKGKKTVASGKGKIGSGKSKKLKLKRGGLGGAKLKASASFKDAAGAKVTSSRKVRVR
jgi:Ca2+-binding RTX toxin-like protein